jgi:hypothetical protein
MTKSTKSAINGAPAKSACKRSRSRKDADTTKRVGRPRALVAVEKTLRQLRELAEIRCTLAEAAGGLLAGASTDEFLGPEGSKEAREAWDAGRQSGRALIKRRQYELAMKGNTRLLIWWGKNHRPVGQDRAHRDGRCQHLYDQRADRRPEPRCL